MDGWMEIVLEFVFKGKAIAVILFSMLMYCLVYQNSMRESSVTVEYWSMQA